MSSGGFRGLISHVPPGQFLRYLLVGGWNTLFGYACFAIFTALLQPRMAYGYVVAIVISNPLSITVSYLGYKWFVFKTKGNYLREWSRCVLVYSGSMLISIIMLPIVVQSLRRLTPLDEAAPYLGGALIMACSVVYSFFGHKHYSFRRPSR